MKRRDFIRNASAMAALPALPVGTFGAPPVSAALIAKAEHMAGLWVHTSANMMKNAFGLDQATANSLFNTLLDKQIVATPNAFGVAKAVVPCYENPLFAAKVESLLHKAQPAKQAIHKPKTQDVENIIKKVDTLLQEPPTEAVEEEAEE